MRIAGTLLLLALTVLLGCGESRNDSCVRAVQDQCREKGVDKCADVICEKWPKRTSRSCYSEYPSGPEVDEVIRRSLVAMCEWERTQYPTCSEARKNEADAVLACVGGR